ncbi:MAG TPA: hypothetical protein VFA44_03930 [Gaiellaceae bacterium]|nr:hypothetical protein [Gaiellaceae bacterium]
MTRRAPIVIAALAIAAAGCGSSRQASPNTSTHAPLAPTGTAAPLGTSTAPAIGPGALQAEANATAAGDIPDNQVFLTFRNAAAGYSIEYPEGWAQQGSGDRVTFRDRNNIVRIVVARGPAPTATGVRADVGALAGATVRRAPQRLTLAGRPAFEVSYSSESAPNAVTGKRVKLLVDRYYLWSGGRRAVVDLGTPVGVDNVDAYRLMIDSFRWR